jgi:hypothetical protein
LIHGFAIEATRLVRDGMADTFVQDALAAGDAFLGVSLLDRTAGFAEAGLRPVFTLRARIPDAGLPHRRRFACAADRRQRKRAGGLAVAG